MTLKKLFQRCQPVQLYIVLVLTLFYFLVQLTVSYFSHSLTLLTDAYHNLCNIIALIGCVLSCEYKNVQKKLQDEASSNSSVHCGESFPTKNTHGSGLSQDSNYKYSETRLRNTFGWARIDVLVMLIGCVILASLLFSLTIEALQTLCHINHGDAIHYSLYVFYVGGMGLILNGLTCLLIGGYSFYQGNYLRLGVSGDITLTKGVSDMINQGPPKRQGIWDMTRDVIGCVMTMVCALIVYKTDESFAKYVDPVISTVSSVLLLILSYPHMRDAGYILLQTIPDHINLDSLCAQLIEAFPNIINVHELHIWQLTSDKIVSTAHIIFLNPEDYVKYYEGLKEFFEQQGITHVTIQPEFFEDSNTMELVSSPYGSAQCLIRCLNEECHARHCCHAKNDELQDIKITREEISSKNENQSNDLLLNNIQKSNSLSRKLSNQCPQQRHHLRNSTPILHLLTTQGPKIKIMKASDINKQTKSCVQLESCKDTNDDSVQKAVSADQIVPNP